MSDAGKDKGGKGGFAYIAEPLWGLAVPIGTLHPDPANARKHNAKNLAAIVASLHRFGQRAPLVVQRKGMVVRAGNGRLEAARSMGWSHVAAVVVDDESIDAVAFAIADNRTAELAEWDNEVLASLLDTLPEDALPATGFGKDDLAALLDGLHAMPIDAPVLSSADKAPFQQMAFIVADGQAETIKAAIEAAKKAGPFVNTGNENSNGNALARMAEAYLG